MLRDQYDRCKIQYNIGYQWCDLSCLNLVNVVLSGLSRRRSQFGRDNKMYSPSVRVSLSDTDRILLYIDLNFLPSLPEGYVTRMITDIIYVTSFIFLPFTTSVVKPVMSRFRCSQCPRRSCGCDVHWNYFWTERV